MKRHRLLVLAAVLLVSAAAAVLGQSPATEPRPTTPKTPALETETTGLCTDVCSVP
jgi:hypothetical protein